MAPRGSRDLQQATKAFLNAFAQDNPELRVDGPEQALQLSQQSAIGTQLVNASPLRSVGAAALHDVRRRRQPVLLLLGCASERRDRVPGDVSSGSAPGSELLAGGEPGYSGTALARRDAAAVRPISTLRPLEPISEVSEAVRLGSGRREDERQQKSACSARCSIWLQCSVYRFAA